MFLSEGHDYPRSAVIDHRKTNEIGRHDFVFEYAGTKYVIEACLAKQRTSKDNNDLRLTLSYPCADKKIPRSEQKPKIGYVNTPRNWLTEPLMSEQYERFIFMLMHAVESNLKPHDFSLGRQLESTQAILDNPIDRVRTRPALKGEAHGAPQFRSVVCYSKNQSITPERVAAIWEGVKKGIDTATPELRAPKIRRRIHLGLPDYEYVRETLGHFWVDGFVGSFRDGWTRK